MYTKQTKPKTYCYIINNKPANYTQANNTCTKLNSQIFNGASRRFVMIFIKEKLWKIGNSTDYLVGMKCNFNGRECHHGDGSQGQRYIYRVRSNINAPSAVKYCIILKSPKYYKGKFINCNEKLNGFICLHDAKKYVPKNVNPENGQQRQLLFSSKIPFRKSNVNPVPMRVVKPIQPVTQASTTMFAMSTKNTMIGSTMSFTSTAMNTTMSTTIASMATTIGTISHAQISQPSRATLPPPWECNSFNLRNEMKKKFRAKKAKNGAKNLRLVDMGDHFKSGTEITYTGIMLKKPRIKNAIILAENPWTSEYFRMELTKKSIIFNSRWTDGFVYIELRYKNNIFQLKDKFTIKIYYYNDFNGIGVYNVHMINLSKLDLKFTTNYTSKIKPFRNIGGRYFIRRGPALYKEVTKIQICRKNIN